MLFLDTEFYSTRKGPVLLSIGMVGPSVPFYAELDMMSVAALRKVGRSKFLKDEVLAQFGRVPGAAHPLVEIARRTALWLQSQGSSPLEVIYDYSVDFLLLEKLLALSSLPLAIDLVPIHVGYSLEDPAGIKAAAERWDAIAHEQGLRRHHAYADAEALRGRFRAVHSIRD